MPTIMMSFDSQYIMFGYAVVVGNAVVVLEAILTRNTNTIEQSGGLVGLVACI